MNEPLPIMLSGYGSEVKNTYARIKGPIYTSIPWAMLTPHEAQAQRNHSQTLQRLAERGGLAPCEAVAILEDRPWRQMKLQQAYADLAAHVAAFSRPPDVDLLAKAIAAYADHMESESYGVVDDDHTSGRLDGYRDVSERLREILSENASTDAAST